MVVRPADELKLAIAEAVTIFSRIDHAVIESVWVLEQADLKRKKQIAKEHAHENIKFIRGVVEEHMKLEMPPTWDALAELRQERNLIAHGVWRVRFGGDTPGERGGPPKGLPMVLWHSKMRESGDFVTAESFDYWRFEKFMRRARILLNTFHKFSTMAKRRSRRKSAVAVNDYLMTGTDNDARPRRRYPRSCQAN